MGCYSTEILTVSNSATRFTESAYLNKGFHSPGEASFSPQGGPIMIKINGEDPTTTDGTVCHVGDFVRITTEDDIRNFRAIRQGPVDCVMTVNYSDMRG